MINVVHFLVKCNKDEFHQLLKGYGLYTLESDLQNVFNRFDKKKEGLINFEDFASELLPTELHDKVKTEEEFPWKRFTIQQI